MSTIPQGNQRISVAFGNQGNVAGAIITSAGSACVSLGPQGNQGPQGAVAVNISSRKHWRIEFRKAHFLKRLWDKGYWVLKTWYEYDHDGSPYIYPSYIFNDQTRTFATEQEAINVQVLEQLEQ
jgi:hypothetical protein